MAAPEDVGPIESRALSPLRRVAFITKRVSYDRGPSIVVGVVGVKALAELFNYNIDHFRMFLALCGPRAVSRAAGFDKPLHAVLDLQAQDNEEIVSAFAAPAAVPVRQITSEPPREEHVAALRTWVAANLPFVVTLLLAAFVLAWSHSTTTSRAGQIGTELGGPRRAQKKTVAGDHDRTVRLIEAHEKSRVASIAGDRGCCCATPTVVSAAPCRCEPLSSAAAPTLQQGR